MHVIRKIRWNLFALTTFTCVLFQFVGCAPVLQPRISIHREFDTTLEPGIWHGFALGPCSDKCAYIAEISPLETSNNGAFVEKYVIQPEFNGRLWQDVLRATIPNTQKKLKVNLRIYKITRS